MKTCSNCCLAKGDEEYYVRKTGKLHSWCIPCMKALRVSRKVEQAAAARVTRAGYTEAQKVASKNYMLNYHFGISMDDYQDMLRKQKYSCAICLQEDGLDKHKGKKTKGLSVDHDHDTGKVRGLLCNSCNRGIGQLGDSLLRLRAAVAYLEQYEHLKASSAKMADDLLDEIMKGTSS